jgi:hypothetical protein
MKLRDETPIDPVLAASLEAIDATLAGEPVDPKFAEIAELALLLSADHPAPAPGFAELLDQRVEQRFSAVPASGQGGAPASRRRWWTGSYAWGGGAAVALAGAVAAVIVVSSGGGGTSTEAFSTASAPETLTRAAAAASTASSSGSSSAASSAAGTPHALSLSGVSRGAAKAPFSAKSSDALGPVRYGPATQTGGSLAASPTPASNGRKIVQAAQLALNAPPTRIDQVAQEVFNVVGDQNGIVNHSNVTASNSPGAYAEFELSVPSGNLSQTMAALSRLRYASVASRTDTTEDVNNQSVGDTRRLADDKAARTALLKRLASAVTTVQVDSLKAQIRDVAGQITADENALAALNHRVNFSQIQLTINAARVIAPSKHGTRGFTLGKASHDAGRVLTVAAGVALIALAVLVPVGLLIALGLWISVAVRRRRREQALDLA